MLLSLQVRDFAIVDRIEAGEMPPENRPQPSKAARAAFLKSIRSRIAVAAQQNSHRVVRRRQLGEIRPYNAVEQVILYRPQRLFSSVYG